PGRGHDGEQDDDDCAYEHRRYGSRARLHARALAGPGPGARSVVRGPAGAAAADVAAQPSRPDRIADAAHHPDDDAAAAAHASGDLGIAAVVADDAVPDLHVVSIVAARAGTAAAGDRNGPGT